MGTSNNNSTIVYSVDATGFEAGVNKIKAGASTVNAAQDAMAKKAALVDAAMKEAAANGFDLNARAANRLASEYIRLSDTAGKTQAQILAQRAAANGVTSTFASMGEQIAQASEHTHGFNLNTMSARRELLVLAHEASQGNWTKFGGSLGVLAERTDALSAILSAAGLGVGLFAAAITFAGVELYKTANAIDALQKSSVATNGYLGLTKDQLTALATQLAPTNGGLVEVSSTLAALVGSGQASAETLSTLTGVVTQFGKDTGLTADKAAEAFVKMLEDPKKGIDELQAKYHTFSAAQIEVIEGYIKTGDTAQATKAFIDAVADSQHRMAAQGTQEVGILARIWQSFSDAAKQAGDNFDRMGVAASNTQKLTDATTRQAAAVRNLAQAKAMPFGNVGSAQAEMDAANAQVAALQKVQAAQQKAANDNKARAKGGDAQVALSNYLTDTSHAGPGKQRDAELAAENAKWAKLADVVDKGSKEYQQALKDHYETIDTINKQYATKTKTHAAKSNEGGINAELTRIAGQNQLIEQEEKRSETVLKSQRDAGLIDTTTYFQKLHDLQANALDQEIANASKRVDVAAAKKQKSAEETALKDYQSLVAQRVAVETNFTDSVTKYGAQRAANVQKFSDQENALLAKQQSGYDATNAQQFMTQQEKANYAARSSLLASFEQQQASLKSQYESPTADKAEYALKLTALQDYYSKAQGQLEANLALQQGVRESFNAQFKLALLDQTGQTLTNAELMRSGMDATFSDMSNALETFVTTGKFSFSSLASSILSDLAKIALKAAETQIFNMVASSFSTGGPVSGVGGGTRSFATGGFISGAGTGTSDSIPAMLSNGEYVVTAAATKKYSGLLHAINSGKMAHFASGGAVGSVASSSTSATSGNTPVSVTVNNNGNGGGMDDKDAADLHAMVQAFVDKRLSQKMRGQGGYGYQLKHGQI
jgi:lambda family phage tail tape measure protein